MNRVPLVSCLIVTYNYADYVVRAVESVLAQDYPQDRLEIVVVDDGSTDQTAAALALYAGRIKYIQKPNGGLIDSTNRALAEAHGDYIAFLSGDDTWPAHRLQGQVDYLEQHPDAGLVYGDMQVIDRDDRVLHASFNEMCKTETLSGRIWGRLLRGNFISGGAMMLRGSLKSVFHPIPEGVAWEDWWFALTISEVSEIGYSPEVVYRYRIHGSNMNLGVTGEKRGALIRTEIPFRRKLLCELPPGKTSLREAVEALASLEDLWAQSAQLLGIETEEVYEVGEEERLRSREECGRGGLALSSDSALAAHHLLRALAHDPWNAEARAKLDLALRAQSETGLAELVRARQSHFAEPAAPGVEPLVSIIIPTYNKWNYTAKCLSMLVDNTRDVPFELILVDNGSTDETRKQLEALREVCRIQLNDRNLGFAKACNQGARLARGKYLLFLNNDTEPQPGWLEPMVRMVEGDSTITAVGSKLLFPDGTIQHGGVGFVYGAPYPITAVHLAYRRPAEASQRPLELRAVTAACMLVRPEAFWAVGGFDEAYVNGYEDVDLCLKLHAAGGRLAYTPESVVIHHESVSETRHLKEAKNLDLLHRRWLDKFDLFDVNEFAVQPDEADPARPGASILVVAYNSLGTIAPCLESLLLHTGPQDEIILVDNASTDCTLQFADSFIAKHPGRVKVIRNEMNTGFSRANNLALRQATRDYVVLLNPDVQVTSGWLDRMMAHLSDPKVGAVGPTADYVAGLQKVGLYLEAKPGEMLESIAQTLAVRCARQGKETNLLIGFCLMTRRDLLNDLGGLDPDLFLGNDDLDLSLRIRERGLKLLVATDAFVRHFGQVSFRTEPGHKTKYLVQQSTNALYEKMWRDSSGQVSSGEKLWGIPWFAPQTGLVSVIVLIRDNLALTKQCLESVYENTHRSFELILVDNGSVEDVASYAAELQRSHGNVKYIRNEENQGYAFGCNQGLAAAEGDYLVLLNNDVVVAPGWLGRQLALLELDPAIGMVGPRTNYSAGPQMVHAVTYQDLSGLRGFADDWFVSHAGQFTTTARITGVCMVLKRSVLEQVGGLDTCFGVGNFEDDDFCLRIVRAGFVLAIADDVFVHHYGSATFRAMQVDYARLLKVNWGYFSQKWDHRGEMAEGYQALELAGAREFVRELDYVPTRYGDVFSPEAAPLALGETRPVRYLCIPDWSTPDWRKVLAEFMTAFAPEDPVTLVVRVEPPLPEVIEGACRDIEALVESLGLNDAASPDLLLETSTIPASARGGLYTAATAFLPVPGERASIYAREAAACGLPVVSEMSREAAEREAACS